MMGPLIIEHVRELVQNTVEIILGGYPTFSTFTWRYSRYNSDSLRKGLFSLQEGWSSKAYACNLLEFGARFR